MLDIGWSIFQCTKEHPKAVNVIGAVSPTTLDTARRTPVNILPEADGSKTFKIVFP